MRGVAMMGTAGHVGTA